MSRAVDVHNALAAVVQLYGATLAEQAREAEVAIKSRDVEIARLKAAWTETNEISARHSARVVELERQLKDARDELLEREDVIATQEHEIKTLRRSLAAASGAPG
jgi:chromosome segregation ATPase